MLRSRTRPSLSPANNYDALIQATWLYDSRDGKKNGDTVNARRARTYLKLLRWRGLRAGDAACLSKDKLRDDDSLFLYQKKVKGKGSSAVYGLLPHDVAEELRNVPSNAYTHPSYFFWSGRSKRKGRALPERITASPEERETQC